MPDLLEGLKIPSFTPPKLGDDSPSLKVNKEEDTEVNPTRTLWENIMGIFN